MNTMSTPDDKIVEYMSKTIAALNEGAADLLDTKLREFMLGQGADPRMGAYLVLSEDVVTLIGLPKAIFPPWVTVKENGFFADGIGAYIVDGKKVATELDPMR